ncbi:MAG: S-layer homology domain-containing protein [Bacillota bacterium]
MKRSLVIFLVLALLMTVSIPSFAAPLKDAPATSHWVYDYYEMLYNAGLIEGYPDGTFKGEKAATRYEVVAFMARLLQYFETRLAESTGNLAPITTIVTTSPEVAEHTHPIYLQEEEIKGLIEEALWNLNYADASIVQEDVEILWDAINALELEFKEDLEAMGVRVTTLEEQVNDHEDRIVQLEAQAAGMQRNLDAIDVNIEELKKADKTNLTVAIGAAILGAAGVVLGIIGLTK